MVSVPIELPGASAPLEVTGPAIAPVPESVPPSSTVSIEVPKVPPAPIFSVPAETVTGLPEALLSPVRVAVPDPMKAIELEEGSDDRTPP